MIISKVSTTAVAFIPIAYCFLLIPLMTYVILPYLCPDRLKCARR